MLGPRLERRPTGDYWREEPFEVDGVIEGSWGAWAVEVKTGSFGTSDLRGLLELVRRYPKHEPLVVCDESGLLVAARAEIAAVTWQEFLLAGPPGAGAADEQRGRKGGS